MTAAVIPRTLGQPDQGFEGNRFTGLTMYDALTLDLSADKPSVADSARDRMEGRRCRQEEVDVRRLGVNLTTACVQRRRCGSNVEKVEAGCSAFRSEPVGVTRADADAGFRQDRLFTVELTTKEPDSFADQSDQFVHASPAKWQKLFETAKALTPRRSRRPPGPASPATLPALTMEDVGSRRASGSNW